jgi:hypothetical protein
MANINIDIAAEFTGKKAFKQAETATDKMSKNAKKLAGALGLAFSGQAILAFGKASIKAAAEDEKAQKQLALALKNVGLGRDAAASEDYIQKLQSEFGIVDDKLRPAYQTLAVATRDTQLAQKLLNLSLDISASTGKDLGSVTAALSRAYLGNNTALGKLGVGISKADLKAGKFEDIVSQLETTFAGSATAAANTFQGSIDKLGVASANVSEIIGTGLIDAIKNLGDDNTVDNLAVAMESTALYIADIIRGIGVLIGQIKTASQIVSKIPGLNKIMELLLKANPVSSTLMTLNKLGQESRVGPAGGFPQGAPSEYQSGIDARAAEAAEKARKAAEAAAARLAALQKKSLKAQQDALKISKAKAIFDMQKIQIEAALKGKISKEDEIRLKLMKAILEENVSDVEKYQKALEKAQEQSKALAEILTSIKAMEFKDPFGLWSVDPLTASINALTASMFAVQTQIQANGKEWSSFANTVATTVIRPNLTEWSSSYSTASANAAAATAAANAALTATTTAASKAAAEAAAASAAAIAASNKTASEAAASAAAASAAAIAEANKASADAIAKAQAEAATTLGKLNAETAASTAAAAKAAQDAIDAANKTAAETVAGILARASAEAAAKAATAAAANVSTLEAFRASEAAAAQTTVTGGTTKIEVTVTGDPFTDPNAVAEKVVEIIRGAGNRGTVDVLGID